MKILLGTWRKIKKDESVTITKMLKNKMLEI